MSRVAFGDVVREVKLKIDRDDNPYEFYVAGDHMDTEDLKIRRRGRFATDDVGPAFIREFHSGQILYGSRRTYLKKIAVADFDGVTANTTFVLETRDEAVLRQRLIPFIMLSEGFTKWSIMKSKGSTNPYVLFSDIAGYEFDLPNIEEQDKLTTALWAVNDTMEAYKKLISETDELVKSQFVEMFESRKNEYQNCSLVSACLNDDDIKCGPFGTQLKQSEYVEVGVPVWGIPQVNATFSIPADTFVTEAKSTELTPFGIQYGDIAMSRKGNIGQCALYPQDLAPGIIASDVLRIRPDQSRLLPYFLMCQLHYSANVVNQIEMIGNGGIMKGINVTKLKNIVIYIPPLALQKQFISFAHQTDKSKFELERALEAAKATYKSIISNRLGADF